LEQHLAIRRGVELRQHFRQVSRESGLKLVVLSRVRLKVLDGQVACEPALVERMREHAPAGDHRIDLGNYVLSNHTLLLAERADSMQTDGAYQTKILSPLGEGRVGPFRFPPPLGEGRVGPFRFPPPLGEG